MTFTRRLVTTQFWAAYWLPFVCASYLAATMTANLQSSVTDDADRNESEVKNRPIAKQDRGYISSEKCRDCHPHNYDTWHSSFHRTMTQVPSKDSVIADFNNRVIRHSGRQFRFYSENDEYFMEMKSIRPTANGRYQKRTFKIVLSTGAHHQQAFWCETNNGRTLAKIPFIWINSEQRWIPYGSIFVMPSSGLSMHAGGWNSNCIKCHVVSGQPRHDPSSGFDTHVAEFGISCEACHGPGETHAAAHENGLPDSAANGSEMINPAELSHQRSSQTCGQCHAVFEFYDAQSKSDFNSNGFTYRPGDNLLDSRHVFRFGRDRDLPVVKQKLKRNPKFYERQFWSDGMVRVSGREFNGLLETPCYQRGTMSCLSCHTMHSSETDDRPRKQWADDQLKPDMRGNQACIQCHQEFSNEGQLVKHTHHPADSSGSSCYNCHMPHTTLGLMKAMRSHTIDSPNVATTLSTGRPNACNLCHLDKTLAWTADRLKNWYDIPTPQLKTNEAAIASSVRWILNGDAGQRAIAGWHFGWKPAQEASGTNWMTPFLAELLDDTYDVVRFIGYHSLKDLPEFGQFVYDFVGSTDSRKQARQRALEQWLQQTDRPSESKACLIDAEGKLIDADFQRIRKKRIDPPIFLNE